MQSSTREELRRKLRQKINEKRQKQPSRQEIHRMKKDINKEFKEVMSDPRVTEEMLNLYTDAMREFPKSNMPNPKTVLDDPDKYKQEYGKYVLNIMEQAKKESWGLDVVKSMLSNSYTKYMTHVLELPKIPSFMDS